MNTSDAVLIANPSKLDLFRSDSVPAVALYDLQGITRFGVSTVYGHACGIAVKNTKRNLFPLIRLHQKCRYNLMNTRLIETIQVAGDGVIIES
jgi:hypothetical protein